MAELRGIEYLRKKLNQKQSRVLLRYKYYEMKDKKLDPSDIIPKKLQQQFNSVLGWCGMAVDSLSDRLVFESFKDDNFGLNEIFEMNNPDIFFDNVILSALISACAFVSISIDERTGVPRLTVVDGSNATGILDPSTGLLTEGYAVLERDEYGKIQHEAYYAPGYVDHYYWGELVSSERIENDVEHPLLVPIIYRPDAKRPFGHSRISRAMMKAQDFARFTLTRSEVTAEFYSFPQKYLLGMDPDAEPLDTWRATISSFIQLDKDDDGGHPVVGQFQQQSMTPHIEQLRAYAAVFAAESGLTIDDLGFPSQNPSSSEAIKASHENLRLRARKAQRTFGSGLLNVGFMARCLADNFQYERRMIYMTKPMWYPVFEPDMATLSSFGDGIIKINQAVPGAIDAKVIHEMTGLTINE